MVPHVTKSGKVRWKVPNNEDWSLPSTKKEPEELSATDKLWQKELTPKIWLVCDFLDQSPPPFFFFFFSPTLNFFLLFL